MNTTTSKLILLAALLVGGFTIPTVACASEPGVLKIDDNGSVFTADGIKKAEDKFSSTSFKSPTILNVVTYGKIPDGQRAAFDKTKGDDVAKKRFFGEWVRDLATSHRTRGIFVLISMEGTHIRAIDDRQTDAKRHFDDADLRTLEKKLIEGFKAGFKESDPALKKVQFDAALLDGTSFVIEQLQNTSAAGSTSTKKVSTSNTSETGGSNIMSYVCIGIVALLGVWIVIGLVRMMTGGGGGGGGGGYGGGGYGGGGGGGGFMSSMLGGMFGAAAGMYLYDSFAGGSHSSNAQASDNSGNNTGDGGAGDYSGGGDGGGGDFGGGDTGGGGGDFGGGSDFGGGGGDLGGGGDFGGGDSGGGDW